MAESNDYNRIDISDKTTTTTKRNLIQEAWQGSKEELISELYHRKSSRTWSRLSSKLSTLVALNPVSCTTDSNLLDGRWCRAASCKNNVDEVINRERTSARTNDGLEAGSTRSRNIKTDWWGRSGWLQVNLEELTEDPYIVKGSHRLGGLVGLEDTLHVREMTRSSIVLSPTSRKLWIMGILPIPIWKGANDRLLDFLYLDVDLCVFREGDGMEVLTKNQGWKARNGVEKGEVFGFRRGLKGLARRVGRLARGGGEGEEREGGEGGEGGEWIGGRGGIKRTVVTGSSEIRVVNIGEVAAAGGGEGGGDEVFERMYDLEREILDDPLGHLGQDERQRIMGGMSLKEMKAVERERVRRERIWREGVEGETNEKDDGKRWTGVQGNKKGD
ncbi:hypothetical protein TrCOL_g7723 [Triparma columacea]|uniref:Uncharacterized protein n=1 Tax=Triparma columacea TaxID=722753 RepID=A0A9W7LCD4_9STRA|nr:hypothetical protein TrCOL_g7723 [Triparma columacea]